MILNVSVREIVGADKLKPLPLLICILRSGARVAVNLCVGAGAGAGFTVRVVMAGVFIMGVFNVIVGAVIGSDAGEDIEGVVNAPIVVGTPGAEIPPGAVIGNAAGDTNAGVVIVPNVAATPGAVIPPGAVIGNADGDINAGVLTGPNVTGTPGAVIAGAEINIPVGDCKLIISFKYILLNVVLRFISNVTVLSPTCTYSLLLANVHVSCPLTILNNNNNKIIKYIFLI
jgi:hypothetical protein